VQELLEKTISIPSGTIKSEASNLRERMKKISIPSGTIKRFHFICVLSSGDLFQFLLVRLKVLANRLPQKKW